MIVDFRHKGLARFHRDGSVRGVRPEHADRLGRILAVLDVAQRPEDLRLPSFRAHELVGRERGRWSVWVSVNWRVTFAFCDDGVEQVDDLDYH